MGWQASNYGALRNSGGNFQRYFKTGAVLYQPIASGTADKDGWEPHTAAGGTARCCVATGGCSPAMVGTLIVREKSRADQQFENVLPEDKKQPTASKDIVDDILNDLDGKQK
ncbi:MAG TPA: hypothetical protein VL096_05175 [Pirellulaceae bacterium]|nr:hypothetical protein [Pirellulaceae bacterium]